MNTTIVTLNFGECILQKGIYLQLKFEGLGVLLVPNSPLFGLHMSSQYFLVDIMVSRSKTTWSNTVEI